MIRLNEIVVATRAHAMELAPRLRPVDLYELDSVTPLPAEDALWMNINCSDKAWSWLIDGRVECVFGIQAWSLISGAGCPWLLSSEALYIHRKSFLQHCLREFGQMIVPYDHVWNYVAYDNLRSREWLEWLGFTIGPIELYGRFRRPFCKFEMGVKHV